MVDNLVKWQRARAQALWAFRYGFSKSHFMVASYGIYSAICKESITAKNPYAADGDFPKCKTCLKMVQGGKNRHRFAELANLGVELWSGATGSATAHYFQFEDGQWRSACGMTRRADQFVDGDFVKCRKCEKYSNK